MGASESVLYEAAATSSLLPFVDDEHTKVRRYRFPTCIAEAQAAKCGGFIVPLACGALTVVNFREVLGSGGYGQVLGGIVDRTQCQYYSNPARQRKLHRVQQELQQELQFQEQKFKKETSTDGQPGDLPSSETINETQQFLRQQVLRMQSDQCPHCFSERTRQVAVKVIKHRSPEQQGYFLRRFQLLQKAATHQQKRRRNRAKMNKDGSGLKHMESCTSTFSKTCNSRTNTMGSGRSEKEGSDVGIPHGFGELQTDTPRHSTRCSCCSFYEFPVFNSLHLLQVFGVYTCKSSDVDFVVMERLGGPTLQQFLSSRYNGLSKEWQACQIITPILKGIDAIHRAGFIHGDIKLENIMFRSSVPHPTSLILVDLDGLTPIPPQYRRRQGSNSSPQTTESHISPNFSVGRNDLSSAFSTGYLEAGGSEHYKGLCCTPQYLPPETVMCNTVSPFVDLYALGCICFLLLEGKFPRNVKGDEPKTGPNPYLEPIKFNGHAVGYSKLCENFMRRLLIDKPRERFRDAQEALSHRWLSEAKKTLTPLEIAEEHKLLCQVIQAAEDAAKAADEAAAKAIEAEERERQANREAAEARAAAESAKMLQKQAVCRALKEKAAASQAASEGLKAEHAAHETAALIAALAMSSLDLSSAGAAAAAHLALPRGLFRARPQMPTASRATPPVSMGIPIPSGVSTGNNNPKAADMKDASPLSPKSCSATDHHHRAARGLGSGSTPAVDIGRPLAELILEKQPRVQTKSRVAAAAIPSTVSGAAAAVSAVSSTVPLPKPQFVPVSQVHCAAFDSDQATSPPAERRDPEEAPSSEGAAKATPPETDSTEERGSFAGSWYNDLMEFFMGLGAPEQPFEAHVFS